MKLNFNEKEKIIQQEKFTQYQSQNIETQRKLEK